MLGDENVYSENDDEYILTLDGLEKCTDIHYRYQSGESFESIAADYNLEPLAIQIMMLMFYEAIEQMDIEL